MKGRTKLDSLAEICERILHTAVLILLLFLVLYAGYGLYDIWLVYKGADFDELLYAYKPDEENSSLGLNELMALNPDVCAWITVDDTSMDYPVVQGQTNLDYISKDFYGQYSASGSIFLDYRNERDFTDFYSLIYGHHMAGNKMFGEIPNFTEEAYFLSHTTGSLYLPDSGYHVEWFACISADGYDELIFNPSGFRSESSRQNLLETIRNQAIQYREINVSVQDRIIALSTCADASSSGRILLFGKISEIES